MLSAAFTFGIVMMLPVITVGLNNFSENRRSLVRVKGKR